MTMSIEKECFATYIPVPERLRAYGFAPVPGGYFYETDFFDGQFSARIFVDGDGNVSGEVIDADTGECYDPIRSELRNGAFVNMVRESYTALLKKIAESCCEKTPFREQQTNRLARYLLTAYGERSDHPFRDKDNGAVFRVPGTGKWYALVMHVEAGKIPLWDMGDENEIVEIVNLKADPEKTEELIGEKGVFPAYHMNHAAWISVVLDGTVDDTRLIELVLDSRRLVAAQAKGKTNAVHTWIIPANPAYYPIQDAFDDTDEICWKQSSAVHTGDTVYLYVGAPYSSVLFRCRAVETDLPGIRWNPNVGVKKRMRLKLERRYPIGKYSFEWLATVGIRAVRGPRGVTEAFLKEIEKE